jgi:hypothetical protein
MTGLLLLAGGFILGFLGPVWASDLFRYVQNRQILKDITPADVDERKLCKGPHSWMGATTLTDEGVGSTQVCQVCGFIPSISKMATTEAIDRIEENNRIRAIQSQIYRDFQAQENGDIKNFFAEELKGGLSFEKLAHVHCAGMTFSARFGIYKSSRAEDIEKAITRTNA